MNKFEVYLWIGGVRFDPESFHAGIAKQLENGADPRIKNEFGETAADWARNAKHDDVLQLLRTFRSK